MNKYINDSAKQTNPPAPTDSAQPLSSAEQALSADFYNQNLTFTPDFQRGISTNKPTYSIGTIL
jgi:hypothetical protein